MDSGVVSGAYSRDLENAVNTVKASEERRNEYMIMMVREQELIEEGREEGINIGREKGREEGLKEGREDERLNSIRSLIGSLKLSAQQAMDALGIPRSEQARYAERL